jgi:hypothetical protein
MFPVTGQGALVLAVVFGAIFGFLLHRGRVSDYDTIVRQFLFKDFTVLKIMLTAIIVGGVGVFLLVQMGYAKFAVKPADLLAISLGAAIFGVGMVILGYCPGTALAAMGAGSLHAVVGVLGMIVGGMLYAWSFGWVKANILPVGAMGKVQLPAVLGVDWPIIFGALTLVALTLFAVVERKRL